MLTTKECEKLGQAVEELVMDMRSVRSKRKMEDPVIQVWAPAHTKGARVNEDGVFLQQDGDEIWLTAAQARRLIKTLLGYYPEKKSPRKK